MVPVEAGAPGSAAAGPAAARSSIGQIEFFIEPISHLIP
jgi:hypothetical protein